jgi:TNF receptor-associated protein 1
MSAETSTIDLSKEGTGSNPSTDDADSEEEKRKKEANAAVALTEEQAADLCTWMQLTLGADKVRSVRTTSRLSDSPAIVTDHESGAMRRMMKMVVSLQFKSALIYRHVTFTN